VTYICVTEALQKPQQAMPRPSAELHVPLGIRLWNDKCKTQTTKHNCSEDEINSRVSGSNSWAPRKWFPL